jgi:hypothetical protein
MTDVKLIYRYRDARSGQYCTKDFALANPDITIRETLQITQISARKDGLTRC